MKRKVFSILFALVLVLSFSLVMAVPAMAATLNVPLDYSTIQAAVTAASPGDTILVAAGTYTEQINITKSLTLSGAGSNNTHIESPTPTSMTIYDQFGSKSATSRYIGHRAVDIPVVRIAASNVTVEGFHVDLKNYVFWDVLGSYSVNYSRSTGILVDHVETAPGTPDIFTGITIQNNKVDGLLLGDKGDGIKVLGSATATVTGNTIYCYGESGINVQAVDSPVRGQYYPTVTANSNTIYLGGPSGGPFGIGFWSCATGSADGNTIYNDPVNDGYALNVWGSRPVSFTNNYVTNLTGIGGLGAQLIESTNLIFTNNRIENQALAGAIWSNPTATITGNTITNCTDGFVVDEQTSGAIAMHNNSFEGIASTRYAVKVGGIADVDSGTDWGNWSGPSTVTVDAEYNWWGNASGPNDPTGTNEVPPCTADPTTEINADGTGGKVSDNVDYCPWLTAAVAGAKSGTTETDPDTVDATTEADVEVIKSGTGTPTITVVKYEDNPGTGFSGDIGKYIDVHIDSAEGVDEIEIRLYYTDDEIEGLSESSLRLYWWDGTDWEECSDSGVETETEEPGYSGYIWARITDDTTPSLDDLAGTPFGGGGSPRIVGGTVLPVDKVSILMPWIGLAVALAFAGVFVARLAHRRVRG